MFSGKQGNMTSLHPRRELLGDDLSLLHKHCVPGLKHSHRALCTSVTIAWASYGPWEKKQKSSPFFLVQQRAFQLPDMICCSAPWGTLNLSEFRIQGSREARQSCLKAGPDMSHGLAQAAGFSPVLLKDCEDKCPQRSWPHLLLVLPGHPPDCSWTPILIMGS